MAVGYRHLPGGADPRQQVEQTIGRLSQLTSPPQSALAFAAWLRSEARRQRLRVPLATIDVLVSPAPADPTPAGSGSTLEPATIGNIQKAYNGWKARCATNKDNLAIFFFSRHGVEKQEHYLLAEDFGENPNNPWLGSFAFDSTRQAFHACAAETQCFFVDACRQVTSQMLKKSLPDTPLDVPSYDESDCAFDLTRCPRPLSREISSV